MTRAALVTQGAILSLVHTDAPCRTCPSGPLAGRCLEGGLLRGGALASLLLAPSILLFASIYVSVTACLLFNAWIVTVRWQMGL